VKDPTVVLHQKKTELARVRIEVEALQTVVPLLDDPMEQLPDLIWRQDLATNSEDRSLADLEVYYPFGKKPASGSELGKARLIPPSRAKIRQITLFTPG